MRDSQQRKERARSGLNRRSVAFLILVVCILGAATWMLHLQAAPPVIELGHSGGLTKNDPIVFVSGDTGLRSWSLGGRVAHRLAADGFSVTGVDSLAAFSRRKTRAQVGQLLVRAMNAALEEHPDGRVILIGQSFGADLLPVGLQTLPADLKARIAKIILIVPGTHAYLQVSPEEILGTAPPDVDLRPLATSLPSVPTTCIYGIEETDTLCPALGRIGVGVVGLPGGHALHRDTDAVFAVVARALRAPDGT